MSLSGDEIVERIDESPRHESEEGQPTPPATHRQDGFDDRAGAIMNPNPALIGHNQEHGPRWARAEARVEVSAGRLAPKRRKTETFSSIPPEQELHRAAAEAALTVVKDDRGEAVFGHFPGSSVSV